MPKHVLPIDFIGVDPGTVAALEELARQEWELEALRAQREQEAYMRAHPEFNAIDGMGQVARAVDAFAFHDWALKLGSYDCWNDRGFNKYIDRIAPETRVKCRAPKSGNGLALQVGWTGESRKRFSKAYGETRGKDRITECPELTPNSEILSNP